MPCTPRTTRRRSDSRTRCRHTRDTAASDCHSPHCPAAACSYRSRAYSRRSPATTRCNSGRRRRRDTISSSTHCRCSRWVSVRVRWYRCLATRSPSSPARPWCRSRHSGQRPSCTRPWWRLATAEPNEARRRRAIRSNVGVNLQERCTQNWVQNFKTVIITLITKQYKNFCGAKIVRKPELGGTWKRKHLAMLIGLLKYPYLASQLYRLHSKHGWSWTTLLTLVTLHHTVHPTPGHRHTHPASDRQ